GWWRPCAGAIRRSRRDPTSRPRGRSWWWCAARPPRSTACGPPGRTPWPCTSGCPATGARPRRRSRCGATGAPTSMSRPSTCTYPENTGCHHRPARSGVSAGTSQVTLRTASACERIVMGMSDEPREPGRDASAGDSRTAQFPASSYGGQQPYAPPGGSFFPPPPEQGTPTATTAMPAPARGRRGVGAVVAAALIAGLVGGGAGFAGAYALLDDRPGGTTLTSAP